MTHLHFYRNRLNPCTASRGPRVPDSDCVEDAPERIAPQHELGARSRKPWSPSSSLMTRPRAKVAVVSEVQQTTLPRAYAVDVTRYFEVHWRAPSAKE